MTDWTNIEEQIQKAIGMRAKKIDANQNEIVEVLRKAGLSVAITSMVGNGFPDLVVSGAAWHERTGKYWKTILVEIKDGDKPPSARKLTPDEKKFHDMWRGYIVIAERATDVLNYFNIK